MSASDDERGVDAAGGGSDGTSGARVLRWPRHLGRGQVDRRGVGLRGRRARRSTSARPPTTTGTPSATARSPPARSKRSSSTPSASSPTTTSRPLIRANALYEGKYPLVSALSRPVIARHLVRAGARVRRRRRRARLHRQGQRPGALRGVGPRARARPRRPRAGPRVGLHPRGLDRLRRPPRHPDQGPQGQPVLDRREPRGAARSSAACSRTRGPRRRSRSTRSPTTPTALALDPWELVVGFEQGVPVSLDGEAMPLDELVARDDGAGRPVRLRPGRHGREPPRRHQEPRDLRVPGRARAAARARRPRVDHARARPHAREGAARAALRGARLRRSVVLAAARGARRVHGQLAAARHRRGAPAPRARAAARCRGAAPSTGSTATTSPPTTRPTRSATRTPRASCASGASRSRRGQREQGGPGGLDDPLARSLRRRPGRRAARVHREPLVRPAPRARRHRRARARTSRCSRAPVCSPTRRRRS